MDKPLFKFLLIAVATGAVIGAVAAIRQVPNEESTTAPLPIFASETPPPSSASNVVSPDGKVTLIMREKKVAEETAYTISISGSEIFSKTLPAGSNLSIPFNTFSPDNKYIFLKGITSGSVSYFVLSLAGGETFDVSGPFAEKFSSDYQITDVTGWGGINLLVINTQKVNGGLGPSFWFEVPGGAFIRLSHTF